MMQCELLEYMPKNLHLHKDIIEILFNNKNDITRRLSDIRGIHYIDHVSIYIIDPDHRITIYSITPSVEYNLIAHELWRYDNSFNPASFRDQSYFWWDEAYCKHHFNEIKQIKEHKHNFTQGISLVRKIENFQIVYSYATRTQNKDLPVYYESVMPELFLIGDYGLKLITDIHERYSDKHRLPFISKKEVGILRNKSKLKLIITNTYPIEI